MIFIPKVFNKILLDIETKFLSSLSFLIFSLITFHLIFYLVFYNFSGDWVDRESSLVTIQIMPNKDENRVPDKIRDDLNSFFTNNNNIITKRFFDDQEIKNDLGLNDLNTFSNIRIPLIIQLEMRDIKVAVEESRISRVVSERKVDIHYHKNDLFEIDNLIYRVKIFIFLFGCVIALLFIFLLTFLLKNSLNNNYKFFEIIQVMGANSFKISINLSLILIKKILPGAFLGIIFSAVLSSIIVKIFSLSFFILDYFSNIFLLVFLLISVLLLLFIYLLVYLIYFLEKRFFA